MISGRNTYTLSGGNLNTINNHSIHSGDATTYSYNVGYYDDTKIKQRISLLETEVDEIQRTDVNFQNRLSILEGNQSNFATKAELSSVEGRVTTLETVPVGLTPEQINQILES